MHKLAVYHREPNPVPSWVWWALGGAVVVGGGVVFARSLSAARRPAHCPPKVLPVPYDWNRSPNHPDAVTKQQLNAANVGDSFTAIISPENRDVWGNAVPGQDLKYPSYTLPVKLLFDDRPGVKEFYFGGDCEMWIKGGGLGDPNLQEDSLFGSAGPHEICVDCPPRTKADLHGYLYDSAKVPAGKQFYLQAGN